MHNVDVGTAGFRLRRYGPGRVSRGELWEMGRENSERASEWDGAGCPGIPRREHDLVRHPVTIAQNSAVVNVIDIVFE